MTETANTAFGFLVSDLTRLLRRQFDRRAVHLGMTRAQWRALKRVHLEPGITQSGLADLLEMDPIAVGRVLDRLQGAGFIERRPDPADRRCWRLHATAKAEAVVGELDRLAAALRQDALRGIPATEVKRMLSVLQRAKDNVLALDSVPAPSAEPVPRRPSRAASPSR